MKASEIIHHMESLQNDKQQQVLMRFFKTNKGDYGEGDLFLGLKVPQTREIVKLVEKDTPLSEVPELMMSCWHEVRLCGFLILVAKFERLITKKLVDDRESMLERDKIVELYLSHTKRCNNWDLVDLSAPKIIGNWLMLPTQLGDKEATMDRLADSSCLWEQRISMVCTLRTLQLGNVSWCLRYAERHLHHPHDLMHKAVGWMLREMGKRVSLDLLRDFLRQHVKEMHRTTLRYAIEKMSEGERQYWMKFEV